MSDTPTSIDFPEDEPGECPNCGGEGLVWGCFEDTCCCTEDDGLGCAPTVCDWCKGQGQ